MLACATRALTIPPPPRRRPREKRRPPHCPCTSTETRPPAEYSPENKGSGAAKHAGHYLHKHFIGERQASWCRTCIFYQGIPRGASVPALILLQPALVLRENVLPEWSEFVKVWMEEQGDEWKKRSSQGRRIPPVITDPVRELDSITGPFKDRILNAVREIAASGVQIFVVYWPDEQFLNCEFKTLHGVFDAHAELRTPLQLEIPPEVDNVFVPHCQVPYHPTTEKALFSLLSERSLV
jgi:hypothetical protein